MSQTTAPSLSQLTLCTVMAGAMMVLITFDFLAADGALGLSIIAAIPWMSLPKSYEMMPIKMATIATIFRAVAWRVAANALLLASYVLLARWMMAALSPEGRQATLNAIDIVPLAVFVAYGWLRWWRRKTRGIAMEAD